MTFLQRLARAEIAAFFALLLFSTVLSCITAIGAAISFNGADDRSAGVFAFTFAFTLALGSIPAFCLGAPGYAWMWHKRHATWFNAVVMGMALGIPWLLVSREVGLLAIAGSAAVIIGTHAICRVGANNAPKQTAAPKLL